MTSRYRSDDSLDIRGYHGYCVDHLAYVLRLVTYSWWDSAVLAPIIFRLPRVQCLLQHHQTVFQ